MEVAQKSHEPSLFESSPTALFFDSIIVTGRGGCSSDTVGLATSTTSLGGDIAFSLRLAPPPAISYLHLDTDDQLCGRPSIVAADGDLLLIHAAFTVDEPPFSCYTRNYFVYEANPLRPSLRRLPDLPSSGAPEIGIARRGDGEYVVAGLRLIIPKDGRSVAPKEEGNLMRYSSNNNDDDDWESLVLSIPYDPEKGFDEFVWVTDKVFVFGCYMCWVDYLRGLLFCDVFADNPELHFLHLPGIQISGCRDFSGPDNLIAAYKTVDASRGVVKFVDVDNGFCGRNKSSGFTITTWTLRMPDLEWEKDRVLQVDDLWSHPQFRQSPVPRWPPAYPVVSKQNPSIVHFILKRCGRLRAKSWMITLDMRRMALISYMPYTDPAVEAALSMWYDPEDEEWDDKDKDDDDGHDHEHAGVATAFSGSLIICPVFCAT